MAERWVLDSSPLILLSRTDQISLLSALAEEVAIPAEVADEVGRCRVEDAARALVASGTIHVADAVPKPSSVLAWDLGAGETGVLSLCLTQPGFTAILDDRAARTCADSFGIPVRGTLGIVLLARRRGIVERARPLVQRLRQAGLYLTDDLADQALGLVGE
jgi:predicted nucleic acid-binding protein